jgi:5-formyltetrahydrofolate cyclo-ligase
LASQSPADRKAALRAGARGARGRERGTAARAALERLLSLEELGAARVVAFYQAIGDEVPVEPGAQLLRERRVRVVYPVVVGADLELAPDPALLGRVRSEEVDVFVVPGVLFDKLGRRLGRGSGHYDRLLARRRSDAVVVGIAYADRVIEALPEDPWDVPMHAVVTDQFVLRLKGRGGAPR